MHSHKILPLLALPMTWIFVLLAFAYFKKKQPLIMVSLVILYFLGTPFVSELFIRYTEGYQNKHDATLVKKADAIIVLSGNLSESQATIPGNPEWGDPDRFFGGLELMKLDKGSRIIFTGGMPSLGEKSYNEGLILKSRAVQFGINPDKILITGHARNTEEEAMQAKIILEENKLNSIILVTSAYHMERSLLLFSNAGIKNISPFPVDFQPGKFGDIFFDILPNSTSFAKSNEMIRELIGLTYYKFISN